MRSSRLRTSVVLGLGLLACGVGSEPRPVPGEGAASEARVRYALCAANVASIDLVPQPEGRVAVFVQLTPAAAEDFARFTGGQLGRMLEVRYGSEVLVEARIASEIRSGTVGGPYRDRAAAEAARAAIEALPEEPCGAD